MVLLYKSYNYINKQKLFFLNESRVEGRGSRDVGRGARGLRGSRGFSRYPDRGGWKYLTGCGVVLRIMFSVIQIHTSHGIIKSEII